MREYYDRVIIVYIHGENVYGTTESLGAYASKIKYTIDGVDHEEIIDNSEFSIADELIFVHEEHDINE